ncbi:MAG: carbamoyltransferase HypF [Henriciella sp.]|nr:carbamoyltransferase HypF [Henriciella sp.]
MISTLVGKQNERKLIQISGTVQGVGFRPFVYRLAQEEQVAGTVCNTDYGVLIDAEADSESLSRFIRGLRYDTPPLAKVVSLTEQSAAPIGRTEFLIASSQKGRDLEPEIPADAAICKACTRDILDPTNRRYNYPFTNCTDCGPRYSITTDTPYDRVNTTMATFTMCSECSQEYHDPTNRRFHAQPNACPKCGPQLQLTDMDGYGVVARDEALQTAASAIRDGKIVAVKGLGGFHLLCDARSEAVVQELRSRKHRPVKPFAIMVSDIAEARSICHVSKEEEALLTSSAAPVVLLRKRSSLHLADAIAPGNPYLGVMLAYTPLHKLLLKEVNGPVIATSGNRGSDPIIINDDEARKKLTGLADLLLTHDRPIERAIEDSVVRAAGGARLTLRRGRGYAPAGCRIPANEHSILALGGQLKNTIASAGAGECRVSPYLGDLQSSAVRARYRERVNKAWEGKETPQIVCDLHPNYASTLMAHELSEQPVKLQHHAAHIYAVLAEHALYEPVTGLAWDGAGFGSDGSVWGGEGLVVHGASWSRIASLKPFSLPGGEAAMKNPDRAAIGALQAADIEVDRDLCDRLGVTETHARQLMTVSERQTLSPRTSSVGRLFDVVAALLGLCHHNTFEGEAAMALEFAAEQSSSVQSYPLPLSEDRKAFWEIDWTPMLVALIFDVRSGAAVNEVARKFHNWLAALACAIATHGRRESVVLGGGCFQNRMLLELVTEALRHAGFKPVWPQDYPPNDGAIALGQVYFAALQMEEQTDVPRRAG